jgi:hypothetical protein
MARPFSNKKLSALVNWEDAIMENEQITEWRESAFHAAVDSFQREHGTIDTVMRMGEAFGRGLFTQKVKEKSVDWTIKEWLSEIEKDVLQPLGSEFTFTKVSHDVATTFINRNPLNHLSEDRSVESIFNLGVMRGLFLSAFPKGKLVPSETATLGQQEFTLKTYASAWDKFERERIVERISKEKKKTDI